MDLALPGIVLHLSNLGGTQACTLTVSDNSYGAPSSTHAVGPAATVSVTRALGASFGWYDLSITCSSDSAYLRRVAGHVETGVAGRTDPLIGSNRRQTVSLSASAAYVQQGLGLALAYTAPAGKLDPKNWIGIFGPNTSPGKGSAVQWVYAPQASGSWVASSASLPVADYNAWYLYRDGVEALGAPVTFCVTWLSIGTPAVTAGQPALFQFAMPASRVRARNWVGLWPAGAAPGTVKWLDWKYVSTASGNVSFDTARLAPGNYAAWMLFDDGYPLLGGPCAFSVHSA
ncbi:MAG: phospholipase domain-containing protein [Telluria sp.]